MANQMRCRRARYSGSSPSLCRFLQRPEIRVPFPEGPADRDQRRRHLRCDKRHCPYTDLTPVEFKSVSGRKLDHLEFIFQQRLSLFNTRRDHEWRIFFGVLFLLGAVDFYLLTDDNVPQDAQTWWPIVVYILFYTSFVYQWGVQIRNHADRRAMDAICKEICADLRITDTRHREEISSPLDCRAHGKSYPNVFHFTYLWAFTCEIVVLLAACTLSARIPFLNPLTHPLYLWAMH